MSEQGLARFDVYLSVTWRQRTFQFAVPTTAKCPPGIPPNHPHFRKLAHLALDSVLDKCAQRFEGDGWQAVIPGRALCWLDDEGQVRGVGPFTPVEKIVEVDVDVGDTLETIATRIAAIYAERRITSAALPGDT